MIATSVSHNAGDDLPRRIDGRVSGRLIAGSDVVVDHAKKVPAGGARSADMFEKSLIIRGFLLDAAQRARLTEIGLK